MMTIVDRPCSAAPPGRWRDACCLGGLGQHDPGDNLHHLGATHRERGADRDLIRQAKGVQPDIAELACHPGGAEMRLHGGHGGALIPKAQAALATRQIFRDAIGRHDRLPGAVAALNECDRCAGHQGRHADKDLRSGNSCHVRLASSWCFEVLRRMRGRWPAGGQSA
jgi:hypothetical protein